MSIYKLQLTSSNYNRPDGNPYRQELIEFPSKEEFEKYRESEYYFCRNEYKNFAQAWTKHEREEAFAKLVNMRMLFKANWVKNQETEKDLA